MNQAKSVTVNLAGHYPTYKKVEGQLVRMESRDPTRRYALTTNGETGETFYVQYSDEEEAQANKQKADWEAAASQREAEAKHLAEEAAKLECSLKYDRRIIAFLDILGWTETIRSSGQDSNAVVKVLGKTLAQLQGIAKFTNSLQGLLPDKQKWPGNAVMTQFFRLTGD